MSRNGKLKRIQFTEEDDCKRSMAVSVYRPQQPPLTVMNIYAHADSLQDRTEFIEKATTTAAGIKGDMIIMGDWNAIPESPEVTQVIASNVWREVDLDFDIPRGTSSCGRKIDYGTARGQTYVTEGKQGEGRADHN